MQTFSHRPFAAAICISLPFAFLSARLGFTYRILLTVAVVVATAALLFVLKSRPRIDFCTLDLRTFISLTAVMTLSLLLTSHALHDVYLARYNKFIGTKNQVSAVVTGIRFEASYASTLNVDLISVDGERIGGSGILLVDSSSGAAVGDVVICEGEFIPIEEAWEDFETDRSFMLTSGIGFAVRCESLSIVDTMRTLATLLSSLRERLSAAISVYIDRESAAISNALLLGERSGLGVIRRDFSRAGVMHLLALSGMHLTLLCSLIDKTARFFAIKKPIRMLLTIAFTVFYAALTGFSPSLLRAGVMLAIMNILVLSGHDRDSVTALFFAVWLIVLCDPASICDVGLLMSFAATFGLLFVLRPARKLAGKAKLKPLVYIFESALISLGAMLFLIPIQYFAFGSISLLTIPATVILAPPVAVILTLLIPYLIGSLLNARAIAKLLAIPIELVAHFMIGTASAMSEGCTLIPLEYPFTPPIMLACAAVMLIMSIKGVRNRLAMFIPLCISSAVFLICVGIFTYNESASIYTIRDGSNDAIILTDGGKCAVIDSSSGSTTIARNVSNGLRQTRSVEVDTYILTHLHRRHTSQLRELYENVMVRKLLIPEPIGESDEIVFADICELADEFGLEIAVYPRPEAVSIYFGDCTLTFYPHVFIKRSTHPLVSFTIDTPELTAAYLASSYTEYRSLPPADVYLQGSHGPVAKADLPPEPIPEGLLRIKVNL